MTEVLSQEEIDALLHAIIAPLDQQYEGSPEGKLLEILSVLPKKLAQDLRTIIARWDKELAEKIQSTKLPIESLLLISDRAIQFLLRRVDTQTIATALIGVNDKVITRILQNLSNRNRDEYLKECKIVDDASEEEISNARSKILEPLERELRETLFYKSRIKRKDMDQDNNG